jgi:hypothetical protein
VTDRDGYIKQLTNPKRKKNSAQKNFMEKVYHIYAKEECLYNNLSEGQFNITWKTLKGMVGLMQTDYQLEDLSYEELVKTPMGGHEHSY